MKTKKWQNVAKIVVMLLAIAVAMAIFASCDSNDDENKPENQTKHTHAFGEWTIVKAVTCTEDGEEARTCACGEREVRTLTATGHTFSETWSHDGTHHWHASTCGHDAEISDKTEHSFGEWIVDTDATEETAGTKHRDCGICGYTENGIIEKLPHQHTYADVWTGDETHHWHASTCGHENEISDKTEHSFGEWIVDTDATEETAGTKHRDCGICSYTENGIIEKLPHQHTFADVWTSDETHHWHASTCGHEAEISDKTEHSFGEWIVDTDATEEKTGTKHRDCGICSYTENGIIEKLPHQHVFTYEWTGDETYHWHAAICGHEDAISNKAAHNFVNGVCFVCDMRAFSVGLAFEKNVDGASYTVTGIGTCADTYIVIPPTYEGLPVTSIGKEAFKGGRITGVIVPNGVTSIGASAFSGCALLSDITVSDSVSDIEGSAFYNTKYYNDNSKWEGYALYIGKCLIKMKSNVSGTYTIKSGTKCISASAFGSCSNLTGIVIPDSVVNIGASAFSGCINLKSVSIPGGVTSIGMQTFSTCYKLESVTIPDGVVDIGAFAFDDCINLTEIVIPESVTTIGSFAFSQCEKLASVTFAGNSLCTAIGENAFRGCKSLTTIAIPNGVSKIYAYTFYGCDGLTNITMPNGITEIGMYAFADCNKLANFTIPVDVAKIGSYAFANCSMTEITLPAGLKTVEEKAFVNCSDIAVHISDLASWCEINFGSYDANPLSNRGKLYLNGQLVTEAVIPAGATKIGNWAFYSFKDLKSVTIPEGVTSIGNSAFYGCSSLESVTLSHGVTSIGTEAFCNCTSLATISLPNSLTSIGESAFDCCSSLASIKIPKSVTTIGTYAFHDCDSLTIYCEAESIPKGWASWWCQPNCSIVLGVKE